MMNFKNIKVGFIGSMNAMPMQYALKFKKDGFDVKYIVESSVTLMRPESHYNDITYPYPNWIKEISFKKTPFKLLLNRYFTKKVYKEMKDCDVIFFNDYGHHISSYFSNNIIKIALFSGSDLDVECNYDNISNSIKINDSLIVKFVKRTLFKMYIDRYRKGIKSCQIISFFHKGMNPVGDRLIKEIMLDKPFIDIRRYDINFGEIGGLEYVGAVKNKKLVILSAVRFLIKTTEYNSFEYKGNDLIIKAIAKYYSIDKNIEVHFIEKGSKENIQIAKKLCSDLGIEDIIIWHKEMSLDNLLEIYKKSDILFDQVGSHWMGSIGLLGLYMGKPVISNARLDIFGDIWGENPVLNATNVDEIFNHLINCKEYEYRDKVGKASHIFAKENVDSEVIYNKYKSAILDLYSKKNKLNR